MSKKTNGQGQESLASARGSLRLYEISALVNYHAVILAESKKAALKEVETWENAWHDTADFTQVSGVDVVDVRRMKSKLENYDDEAHDCSPKAFKAVQKARRRAENNQAQRPGLTAGVERNKTKEKPHE